VSHRPPRNRRENRQSKSHVDGGYIIFDRSTGHSITRPPLCFRQSRKPFCNRPERRTPRGSQLITCAFYLRNNFVHPLVSGCEVCMIRNEKSQLNPPFSQNDLFHFGNERRFIRMAAASYGTAAFPLFAPIPAFGIRTKSAPAFDKLNTPKSCLVTSILSLGMQRKGPMQIAAWKRVHSLVAPSEA